MSILCISLYNGVFFFSLLKLVYHLLMLYWDLDLSRTLIGWFKVAKISEDVLKKWNQRVIQEEKGPQLALKIKAFLGIVPNLHLLHQMNDWNLKWFS